MRKNHRWIKMLICIYRKANNAVKLFCIGNFNLVCDSNASLERENKCWTTSCDLEVLFKNKRKLIKNYFRLISGSLFLVQGRLHSRSRCHQHVRRRRKIRSEIFRKHFTEAKPCQSENAPRLEVQLGELRRRHCHRDDAVSDLFYKLRAAYLSSQLQLGANSSNWHGRWVGALGEFRSRQAGS